MANQEELDGTLKRYGRAAITTAGNYTMYLELWAQLKSQSQTNNTSTVYTELRIGFSGQMSAHCYTHTVGFTGGTFSDSKTVGSYYHGWEGNASTHITLLSSTKTISHNTDGTKTIKIGGTFSSTNGWSAKISNISLDLKTIERGFSRPPTIEVVSLEHTNETETELRWATSEGCSSVTVYYKTSNASSYSTWPAQPYSSGTTGGTIILTGLSANTSYNIYAACTKEGTDPVVVVNSGVISHNTYPYPYIKSIGSAQITLPVPDTNYSQSITLENPLGRTGVTVYAKPTEDSDIEFGSVTNSSLTPVNLTLPLIANRMYGQIPNSTSGNMVYYCVYNDGTNEHRSTKVDGTYITSAENCRPTVSGNISYANTTTAHATLVGDQTIIQGQSSFTITAPTTTARGSASIRRYYFKIGNGAYESVSTNSKSYLSTNLNSTTPIYCYAEDSRGYTSVVSPKDMRIIPYSAPTGNFEVKRANSFSDSGSIKLISATRSQLTASGSSVDVNGWNGNSSGYISFSISAVGTPPSTMPEPSNGTIGGMGANLDSGEITITNINLENAFNVVINISDKITTRTLTLKIDKAQPILSMLNEPSAVGVNKIPDSNDDPGLYVNGVLDVTAGHVQFLKASGNNGTTTNITSDNIKIGTTVSGETSEVDLNGNVDVSGTLDVVGNTTVTGTLGITGDTTVSGDLNVTEDLFVDGIDILTTLNGKTVIESGYIETGNLGYYIKFSDGTMITRHTAEGSANITTAWGSGYTTGSTNTVSLGNFPMAFLSGTIPYIWVTPIRNGYNYWLGTCNGTDATTAGVTSLLRFTSASVDYRFRVLAFGRWKPI